MIRAIVWKTAQEGAPIVLLAFVLIIGLNLFISIDPDLGAEMQLGVCVFIWHLSGVFLAASLFPQERDRGTLPFLLSQPLARANLLASFILGGLLLLLTMFALTIPWCSAIINIVRPYTLVATLSHPLVLIGMVASLLAFSITVFISSTPKPADPHGWGPLLVIGTSLAVLGILYVPLINIGLEIYSRGRGLPLWVLVRRASGIGILASLFLLFLSIVLEGVVGSASNRERAASLPYALLLLLTAGMFTVTIHSETRTFTRVRLVRQKKPKIEWFTASPTRPELVVSVGKKLLRVDTSGQMDQLFRGPIRNLSWSPTGNDFAFWREHFGFRWILWTMNRDGSQLRKVAKTIPKWSRSSFYLWSPDGEDLIVLKDLSERVSPRIGPTKVLESIGPTGATSIDLSGPLLEDSWLRGLGWLEGKRFLYARRRHRRKHQPTWSFWTIGPGDTIPTRVAEGSPGYWNGVAPRGTRVWSVPLRRDTERQGIWLMDPDDWEWVKIENGKVRRWLGKGWSHDGHRLIYSALRHETEDLVVYDIDTGEKTILYTLPWDVPKERTDRRPSRRGNQTETTRRTFHRILGVRWSPDDDRILFLQREENWDVNLLVFDLSDGQIRTLASNVARATWLTSADIVYRKKDELWLTDRDGREPRKIYPVALDDKRVER